eukprot:Skav232641  [mRNA]  locus=scaffold3536:83208:92581:- [translate_table: standard]
MRSELQGLIKHAEELATQTALSLEKPESLGQTARALVTFEDEGQAPLCEGELERKFSKLLKRLKDRRWLIAETAVRRKKTDEIIEVLPPPAMTATPF